MACDSGGSSPISSRKQRAAVRAFDRADDAAHGAGEGALLGAEQLGAQELFVEHGAVERQHRTIAPAVAVKRVRQTFFSRA